MTTKTLATILIILGGIAAASAQEYQSQSTQFGPGYRITTYEDGSTSTRTWHVSPTSGRITDIQDTNTHATPVATRPPARGILVAPKFNHDGQAFAKSTPVTVTVAQSSVTVITGPMTVEQIEALMGGKAQ